MKTATYQSVIECLGNCFQVYALKHASGIEVDRFNPLK